jgi:hypothetical protein
MRMKNQCMQLRDLLFEGGGGGVRCCALRLIVVN